MSLLSALRTPHIQLAFRQPLRCTQRHSPLRFHNFSSRSLSGRARPPPRSSDSSSQQNHGFFAFLDAIPPKTVFWSIVGINTGVFCVWRLANTKAIMEGDRSAINWMFNNFTSGWFNLTGHPWSILTAAFSHSSFSHFLVNCLGLFWLAKPLLEQVGTRLFLPLYIGGALGGSGASLFWKKYIRKEDVPSLGASAALSAVMSFLACAAPRMPFYLYGIFGMPAWLVVSGLLGYDLYATFSGAQSSTDTAGHVGGFLTGAAYFLVRKRI